MNLLRYAVRLSVKMSQAKSQGATIKCQTVPYLEAAKTRGNVQDEITERWLTATEGWKNLNSSVS